MEEKNMNPHASKLTVPVYFLAAIFIIWGISLRVTQTVKDESFANVFPVGYLFTLTFMVLALLEIWRSGNIAKSEKWMWTSGILLTSLIAGLVYVIIGRNKVLGLEEEEQ
ncbi:MAG: hypothetical protein MUE99_09425 [Chitinophagaceae bacterium]|nr:hypothetical protein [Chitinophagaceae bacterium]